MINSAALPSSETRTICSKCFGKHSIPELDFQLMRFMSSPAARPKVLRFGTRLFPLFYSERKKKKKKGNRFSGCFRTDGLIISDNVRRKEINSRKQTCYTINPFNKEPCLVGNATNEATSSFFILFLKTASRGSIQKKIGLLWSSLRL